MDFNRHALEGIQLAGDPVACPDYVFLELVPALFEIILNRETDAQSRLEKLEGIDQTSLKLCFLGLSTFVVEVAKSNVEESSISSILEECKWTSDRIEDFDSFIKINLAELRMILGRLDFSYPHIVDVDWKLDACVKSNHLERMDKFNYQISLKTQEPGKSETFDFSCSMEQLQDLVSKLRDATKSMEKACEV